MKRRLCMMLAAVTLLASLLCFGVTADDAENAVYGANIPAEETPDFLPSPVPKGEPTAVSAVQITLPDNPFKDVVNGKWYVEGILWCYKYGYMSGTESETFSPDSALSRAMFAQILYSADLASEKYTKSSFKDVSASKWYFNAVEWAYRKGYASGTGGGYFKPDSPVTREQLAVFLYNYAKNKGVDVSASADLGRFTDGGTVSSWAKTALSWAVAQGLISGSGNGAITPSAKATRAQSAVMISAFLKKYGIPWDNGTVVTIRTCTTNGVTDYHALDGSGRTMRVTLKAWHNYGYGKVTKAAACTATGTRLYTCAVCKAAKTETIAATGHKWDGGKVTKAATCTAAGAKTFTCTVCKATRTESIAAAGHKWNSGKVTLAAACTVPGVRTYTCTVCGSTRAESIAAIGHTTNNGICSRCGSEVFPNTSEKLRYYIKANSERPSDEYAGAYCIDCKNIVNNSNYFCTLTLIPSDSNAVMIDVRSKYFDTETGEYAGTMKMSVKLPYISTSYHYELSWDESGEGKYKVITNGWITSANVSADPNVNTVTGFGKYYGASAQKTWFLREMNEILTDGLHAMEGKIFGTAKVGKLTLKDLKFAQFD